MSTLIIKTKDKNAMNAMELAKRYDLDYEFNSSNLIIKSNKSIEQNQALIKIINIVTDYILNKE